jgi:hypothetical protein
MFVVLRWPYAVIYRQRAEPRRRGGGGSPGAAPLAPSCGSGSRRCSPGTRPVSNFNETYGSLGAVIGFMTWLWISAIVILLGAELDAEDEHQTVRDTTTGSRSRWGHEGPGLPTRLERHKAGDAGSLGSRSGSRRSGDPVHSPASSPRFRRLVPGLWTDDQRGLFSSA